MLVCRPCGPVLASACRIRTRSRASAGSTAAAPGLPASVASRESFTASLREYRVTDWKSRTSCHTASLSSVVSPAQRSSWAARSDQVRTAARSDATSSSDSSPRLWKRSCRRVCTNPVRIRTACQSCGYVAYGRTSTPSSSYRFWTYASGRRPRRCRRAPGRGPGCRPEVPFVALVIGCGRRLASGHQHRLEAPGRQQLRPVIVALRPAPDRPLRVGAGEPRGQAARDEPGGIAVLVADRPDPVRAPVEVEEHVQLATVRHPAEPALCGDGRAVHLEDERECPVAPVGEHHERPGEATRDDRYAAPVAQRARPGWEVPAQQDGLLPRGPQHTGVARGPRHRRDRRGRRDRAGGQTAGDRRKALVEGGRRRQRRHRQQCAPARRCAPGSDRMLGRPS